MIAEIDSKSKLALSIYLSRIKGTPTQMALKNRHSTQMTSLPMPQKSLGQGMEKITVARADRMQN